jgi:hypothetical protein
MPNATMRPNRPRWLRGHAVLLGVVLAQVSPTGSSASETCRFAGTTDYAGHVAVTTTAVAAGDTVHIDVVVRLEATTGLWLHLRYLVEEISEWRHGTLQRLDANTRYLFDGRVVRQQWDDFRSARDGLEAYRLQGKRKAQFGEQYPRFAQHWDLADFGAPWLDDYARAGPDRRPDLDLKPVPSGSLKSPFALAFYWVRFLPPGRQHVPVFLPGFKVDKVADVELAPGAATRGHLWQADLHHAYLYSAPVSRATAEISGDGYLKALSFELHGSAGSATGSLQAAGCTGSAAR